MGSSVHTVTEQGGQVKAGYVSGWGLLTCWHLLSLDAPTVAVTWTWFVARVTHVELPWTELAAMFIAVWLLYAADRLLDARGLGTDPFTPGLEQRHLFHHQHRVGFRLGIGVACAALTVLLPDLAAAELLRYVLLGVLLAGWFVVIHTGRRPLPKEFIVGGFFAAAVFIPTIARDPGQRGALVLPAIALGVLCSLNCLFIFAWEHEGKSATGAHPGTRLGGQVVLPAAVLTCLAGLLAAAMTREPARGLVGACAVSAGLLVGLHLMRRRVEKTALRAFCDAVLLTPLLFGLWVR
jgi:hypothetical protein